MHRLLSPLVAAASATVLVAQALPVEDAPLQRTRAVWFVQNDNPIGAEVGFRWQALPCDDLPKNGRVPLAFAAWAALETFTDLRFGKVEVEAGEYYTTLERRGDAWTLHLHDAAEVRAQQTAPGGGKKLPEVASIALDASTQEPATQHIEAVWEPDPKGGAVTFVLRLGSHRLAATATVAGSEGASPIALPDPRDSSRLLFHKGKGKPSGERTAFAVVDHGRVAWRDERGATADRMPVGRRWRLGKDWTTTLDTNVPLRLGDEKLAAGAWHLTLEKTADGWALVVSSAADDLRARLDGFAADHVQPVLTLPLRRTKQEPPAERLRVGFVAAGEGNELEVVFGGERLAIAVAPAKRGR